MRIASRRSAAHVHGIPGGYHPLINTPVTCAPARFSKAADTAESTPPESPTKIFFLREVSVSFISYVYFCIPKFSRPEKCHRELCGELAESIKHSNDFHHIVIVLLVGNGVPDMIRSKIALGFLKHIHELLLKLFPPLQNLLF